MIEHPLMGHPILAYVVWFAVFMALMLFGMGVAKVLHWLGFIELVDDDEEAWR